MTFRVGQVVECINASVGFGSGKPVPLKLHAKYTVADIERQYICIVGLGIMWLAAARFRPIVERKSETDISFAHEILRKASRKETVRA
jgi:hypothetical protein